MNGKEKVCVSFGGGRIEDIDSAIGLCNWLELRLDLCTFTDNEYINIYQKKINTIAADHSPKTTVNLLKSIELGVNIVDIDLDNADFDLIYTAAKENNLQIIASYHNFEKLPEEKELMEIIEVCINKNVDYCKIACKLNTNKDILTIAQLYENPRITEGNMQLLAMGLGEYGPLSRLMAFVFGSPFIYCSYIKELATAPGQLNVFDFYKIYPKLFV